MKNILRIFLVVCAFSIINFPVLAEDIRVQCSNTAITLTMSVPSTNVKCLTVMNSEAAGTDKPLTDAKIASASVVINDYMRAGNFNPEVTVFSMNALSSVNSEIYTVATNLAALLKQASQSEGNLTITPPVPFLPYQLKTQLFASLPTIIHFDNGIGIRTVTAYGDAGSSVSNDNLVYSMQGITQDESKYISAVIPISNMQITGPVDLTTFDWSSLPAESWNPSLSALDSYMQTIITN
jgi:hypothetical protein